MAKSQLDMVIRMAVERRDEAAQRLADGQAAVRAAQEQVDQLTQYQQMYIEQNQQQSTRGISVQALSESRRFIGELSNLIRAQQDTVSARERDAEGLAEAWREATRYLQAVEKLSELRANEAKVARDKREQQQMDDLYSQRMGQTKD